MRCHKARLKLTEGDRSDPELLEHLRSCQACAQFASADDLLNGALRSEKSKQIDSPTELKTLRARLAAHAKGKERSVMAPIFNVIAGHKRMGIILATGFFALLFFLLIPFPYQRTVGYEIHLDGIKGELAVGDIMNALHAIGFDRLSVKANATPDGNNYIIYKTPDPGSAREISVALASLTGAEDQISIVPIAETVTGSLYAQARDRLIRVEVNATGKTDDQIKAEIESKLAAQGFNGNVIYVKTDSSGERRIKLEISENGEQTQGVQPSIEVDARGKTPEQIESEIKSRLAEQGRPNANVTVRRDGADSLRQIRIEIEDSIGR